MFWDFNECILLFGDAYCIVLRRKKQQDKLWVMVLRYLDKVRESKVSAHPKLVYKSKTDTEIS